MVDLLRVLDDPADGAVEDAAVADTANLAEQKKIIKMTTRAMTISKFRHIKIENY